VAGNTLRAHAPSIRVALLLMILAAVLGLSLAAPTDARASGGQIVFDGDSLSTYDKYPTQLMALLGAGWSYQDVAVPGQDTDMLNADAAMQVDPLWDGSQPLNVVCVWCGTNNGAYLGSATYDAIRSYCLARRAAGFKTVVFTILPRSDTFAPGDEVLWRAGRLVFNGLLRTNWTGFADGLADVAADSRIGDDGDSEDTAFYVDKVHLTTAGYAIVAGLAQAAVLGIDIYRPTTAAPYAATVTRGNCVKLRYRVNDVAPNRGTASVKIRIRTLDGRLVKKIDYARKPVNTLLYWRFRCRLARHAYRFYIYATDAAGNVQSRVGHNRLTVR
jgi:hypothetical protein